MSSNLLNQSPYLREQRNFPTDTVGKLSVELDKSYLDIANTVNTRTISLYAVNKQVVNGEAWFVSGGNKKQQALRQVYVVTGTGNIPHGITTSTIAGFTRIYGTFTDGSIWYPLPYVNATAANNQIQITVTSANIVITAGGGAPPTVSSGFVVLEWISSV